MVATMPDFTASSLTGESGNESALQNDGAVKKDALQAIPLRITRMGEVQTGKFGPYAIADYELIQSTEGVQDTGQVFVENRLMRVFQRHFVNNPRRPVRGMFLKSPILKSDGKKYNGWQFVDDSWELQVQQDGTYVILDN